MKPPTLSIVIPVFNEERHIGETIRAAENAVVAEAADLTAELVVVDDGSTDGTAEVARAAAARLPTRVVSQPNGGRFAARSTGLAAAEGDYVLFLDSRVKILPGAVRFLAGRLRERAGEEVWNGHCVIAAAVNPYGHFWDALTELVFSDYFSNPRTTSFDAETFDRFPKGTTCFVAPRTTLEQAFAAFGSRYDDLRRANDDTPLIRWIAERGPIHISPDFACLYEPRASLRGFLRHAYHRGIVFLDGHGRRESRFFPAVLAFYPASAACALLAVKRPVAVPVLAGVVSLAAGGVAAARGRSRREAIFFAALVPVYALAHGAGMWRGLTLLAEAQRARSGSPADAPPR